MQIFNLRIVINLVFIYLLLFTDYTQSQSYLVQTYAENDGLSNSLVFDVAQDKSGRMWFTTRGGLSVYDGYQWKSYTLVEGLSCRSYFKIKLDKQGVIWTLPHPPKLCLSYLNNYNEWVSIPTPDSLDNPTNFTSFEIIFINDQRYVAIGTCSNGVYLYMNKQWKQITRDDGLLSNRINGIATWQGNFYVATDSGISIINDNKVDNSLNELVNLPSSKIIGIAVECNDNTTSKNCKIWLHGNDWIGFLEEGLSLKLLSNNVKTYTDSRYFYTILQPDYNGGLYYGNPYNLFHIDGETGSIENLNRESGLITEGATSLFIDREKNLWITSLRGVSKISSKRFANYHKIHGLLDNEVTAILEIEPGKFVFGHKNGLTYFDGKDFQPKAFLKNGYPGNAVTRVLDISIDSQKNIWVAASRLGLAKVDKNGDIKWYRESEGLGNYVPSVLIDQSERVWVSSKKGLHILKGENFIQVNSEGLNAKYIRRIIQGPDSSIYLATPYSGVFVLECNKWKQYRSPQGETANNVYSILIDTKGRVWIGTLAGLFRLQNNEIIKFNSNGFKINRPVYVIVEDKKERLWFGTDNGVIRWDGQNVREYTVHQGFAGQETNRAAGIVDSQGQVWVGTDLGVSCYQEEFDSEYLDIPPPLIELLHVEVADQKLPLNEVNKLNYNMNNLVFHFRGISFIDEKAILYRSKLEGFDKDWITENQPGNGQIRYTHLSPGHYQFNIQAKNSLGNWSTIASSHDIIIQKPFWKEGWFYLLCILFGGSIIYSVQRNITDKRYSSHLKDEVCKRTAQLQESEKRYRQMFENNHAIMLLIDPRSGVIVDANPAACKYYGYPLEKMKMLIFNELNNTSSIQILKKNKFEKAEGSTYLILQQKLASSKIHDVEIYSCPINIQDKKLLFLIIHDITDRKQAEAALAAEKKRLAVTLRSIGDGVISTNIEGQIVLMNKVAEELTGWKEKEAIGKPINEVFNIINEKTRERCINPVEQVIKTGTVVELANHTILISRNGTERIIADTGAPIRDKDNNISGVALVFRDITEQRKIERELIKTTSLESIGMLAEGIAHDFNNILTTITGNISLARLKTSPEDDMYEMLTDIEKASKRANDLTQQLLIFSKGGMPIKKTVSIVDLVRNSASFALRGSKVYCKFSIPDEIWAVDVDVEQMIQVINNLLINAAQSMPQGGVIQVRLENIIVNAEHTLPLRDGKYVKVSVEDQGVGIPDRIIQKIFDPYFTTKEQGSGLGLATSYYIIKKHDGFLTVESKEGVGTTFYIYLPGSPGEILLKKEEKDIILPGKGKVLLMDDEEDVRKIAGKMLTYLGYNTNFTKNVAEAIDLFKQAHESGESYDVVIMDLTIPGGIGGKEAIEKLLEIDPKVKTVVSSGYSTDPIIANFRQYGFSGVIKKPYKIEELSKVLYSIIENGVA